ncbi:MAG: hypothetical protein KJ550_06565 [Proteobacteria bacterium]|nr:hypothetical protein [Desulfobacteraceae bacterium]MBU2522525.1 hypothetical protein [Pseudomonadota bacterium]MBU3981106.1 hypothetical protein [Pseudomonadota bacterium]MBU4013111.1 hypothetical protein [Pseudomonadota bacterium]MBU4068417.1 hypothetical protein [Pseudomonadota bacterium]
MIESYAFGSMVVDGRKITSDLIIYPDGRIEVSWWRKAGHRLASDDIGELIRSGPDVIIAGTGSSGLMKPEKELEEVLQQKGIEFISVLTRKAVKIYNDLSSEKNVGACFHLTC